MTDERPDFERVFSSLDEGKDPMPPYAEKLWSDLQQTLHRAPAEPAATLEADVLDLEEMQSGRRRPRRFLAGAAAAAVAAAALVFVVGPDDSSPVDAVDGPATTILTPTTLSVLTDPVEACARYHASEWSIERLRASDLATANLDAAIAALDQLRVDLAASGAFDDDALAQLDAIRGSLVQASVEVDAGEFDRAIRSIERFGSVVLNDPATGEDRCAPADG